MTNVVLDVLKLRRVRLDYVSPPICPPQLSGSGTALVLEAVDLVQPPMGVTLLGNCNNFVVWDRYDGLLMMSLSKAVDINQPDGDYSLLVDGLPVNTVHVCSPGWWKIQVTDAFGNIGPFSSPVKVESGKTSQIAIPIDRDSHSYTLWQNPDLTAPSGTYHQVLESERLDGAFEICSTGCYKLQAITQIGVSGLSQSACRVFTQVVSDCADNFKWHWDTCSCVCEETVCPQGFHFDFTRCECWCDVQACTGNFRWDSDICDCVCDPGTCDDPSYEWDLEACECVLWGCPDPETPRPTIADWGATSLNYGFFDQDYRIWYLPSQTAGENPPLSGRYLQKLSLIDTSTNTYLGDATDPTNKVNTFIKGRWNNAIGSGFINSKYGYAMVLGTEKWMTWIDRATREVAYSTLFLLYAHTQKNIPYDAIRGYAYGVIPYGTAGGNRVDVDLYDLTPPGSHLANYTQAQPGGGSAAYAAYCPETDCVYIPEYGLTDKLYHKFHVASHTFTMNINPPGVAAGSKGRSAFYVPHVKIIIITSHTGTVYFIDPFTDTLLGSAPGAADLYGFAYDICTNSIYLSSAGSVDKYEVGNSFNHTVVLGGGGGADWRPLTFDQNNALVYACNIAAHSITTV